MKRLSVRRMTRLAMLLAVSIVLSIVEGFIPTGPIPGIKLGLANAVALYILYKDGVVEAIIVSILRVLLAGLLRGTIFQMGFWMSVSGMILSLGMMILFKLLLKKFSIIGVSIIGAIFHSVGQILIAMLYLETAYVGYYLPILILISVGTGILTGFIAKGLLKIKIE